MSCSWRLLLARWRRIQCKSSNWPFPPCLAGGALCSLFVCSDTGAATLVGGGLSSKHNTTSWILSVLGDQKGFINAAGSYLARPHMQQCHIQIGEPFKPRNPGFGRPDFRAEVAQIDPNCSKFVKKWPKIAQMTKNVQDNLDGPII